MYVIGRVTQVGVTTSLVNITSDAVSAFLPQERRCWMEEEIQLQHFPRADSFRCPELLIRS